MANGSTTSAVNMNAKVVSRYDVYNRYCILHVRPNDGKVPRFCPGQHITVGLPSFEPLEVPSSADVDRLLRLTKRKYSIASSAKEHRYLEFFVVHSRERRTTPHIWNLKIGASIWLDHRAEGSLGIEDLGADRDVVLVSTGSAIAPAMSILRTYSGQEPWRRLVIINGARRVDDLGYHFELEAAARAGSSIRYLPILSREPKGSDWQGLRGHVQDVLREGPYHDLVGAALSPEHCDVILSGNPEMIASVRELLEIYGFRVPIADRPGNLHLERYW